MIIIDLIRHVKVDGAAALYGKTDVAPLIDENKQLLSQLSQRENYDIVVSSPLQRCRLLAEQLAKKQGKALLCLEAFQEMDFGHYDGIAFENISMANDIATGTQAFSWLILEKFFQAPAQNTLPQAESLAEFNHRVSIAWHNLITQQYSQLITKQQQDKRIALIAHAGVIRMILADILALDWKKPTWHQNLCIAYGSLTTIIITNPFQGEQLLQQVNTISMPMLARS